MSSPPEPHVMEDCRGVLQVLSDGTVRRSDAEPAFPVHVQDGDDGGVEWKDVVYDPDHGLGARLYRPRATSAASARVPVVAYFHGGGFCIGSCRWHVFHAWCLRLAAELPAVVASFDYRLAPEHRLPAAYDDAWAALRWAVRNARAEASEPWLSRHADPARLFLVGDSAGGNIAHNMAIRAGREGLDVRGIALLDPYFWGKRPVPSETTDAARRRQVERNWDFVCAGRYGIDDPVVNPVAMPQEEWRHLPCSRVLVTVAGLDKLSARGRAYVHALKASGWRG
jgi:acetyl esterase/lipase